MLTYQNHIDNCDIVFNTLVQNENDIIGLLAYSYYKARKKDVVNTYKIQNNLDNISAIQLRNICGSITAGNQLNDFRKKAEEILQQFVTDILKEDMEDFESELQKRIQEETEKIHNQISSKITIIDKKIFHISKKGFWYGVWQNLFSSFLFMLLPIVTIVIYISSHIGWKEVFNLINNFP